MLGCHVVEGAKDSLLIAEEAVANPLVGDQPIGGLGYLAEGGVHAKERQQGNHEQPADTRVAVVDLTLVFRQQLPNAKFPTGQRQDHDCGSQRADEAEGKQDQRQPGANVAEDYCHPQGELGAEPTEQVNAHDHRQQAPPDPPRIDDQHSELGPKHPSILRGSRFADQLSCERRHCASNSKQIARAAPNN
jgi:hypothetical protein